MTEAKQADRFETWAIVELLGHVRTAGRVTEEERFGTKLGRVDIPEERDARCVNCTPETVLDAPCPLCRGGTFVTQYFGGGSVYRLTPCDEPTARRVAAASQPHPIHSWEMPSLPAPQPPHDDMPDLDDDPDEDEAFDADRN